MVYNDLVFDFETLGQTPDSVVLDLAAVAFNLNDLDNFNELIEDEYRTFRVKFDVASQMPYRRKIDEGTLKWWSEQSAEAKKVLTPSKDDVHIQQGLEMFVEFVKSHPNIGGKKSVAFVRGQSFDFPILGSLIESAFPGRFKYSMFPVPFWAQRDTRTAIAHNLRDKMNTRCPVPKGMFKNFIAHNSIHDCCRDVVCLQLSERYSDGVFEIPSEYDLV